MEEATSTASTSALNENTGAIENSICILVVVRYRKQCRLSCDNVSISGDSVTPATTPIVIGDATPNNETPRIRLRFKDPSKWNVNVQHRKRMLGQEYTTRKGVVRPAKVPPVMETCTCRFGCEKSIVPEQQAALLKNFLALGDTARQKAYLSQFIDERPVKRKRPRTNVATKEKTVSRYYYLPSSNENGELNRVCLRFFTFIFQVCNHASIPNSVHSQTAWTNK